MAFPPAFMITAAVLTTALTTKTDKSCRQFKKMHFTIVGVFIDGMEGKVE